MNGSLSHHLRVAWFVCCYRCIGTGFYRVFMHRDEIVGDTSLSALIIIMRAGSVHLLRSNQRVD